MTIQTEELHISETYTYPITYDSIEIVYDGRLGTYAYIVLSGKKFIIGNVNGYLAWNYYGENYYLFNKGNQTLHQLVGNELYIVKSYGRNSIGLVFTLQKDITFDYKLLQDIQRFNGMKYQIQYVDNSPDPSIILQNDSNFDYPNYAGNSTNESENISRQVAQNEQTKKKNGQKKNAMPMLPMK